MCKKYSILGSTLLGGAIGAFSGSIGGIILSLSLENEILATWIVAFSYPSAFVGGLAGGFIQSYRVVRQTPEPASPARSEIALNSPPSALIGSLDPSIRSLRESIPPLTPPSYCEEIPERLELLKDSHSARCST